MRGVWAYARGLARNGTAVAAARRLTSLALPDNSSTCKIAIVQMCSSSSVDANTISCMKSIETAAASGAKMVFFPECFLYISGGDAPASQPKPVFTLDHPVLCRFRQAASAHNVWLSLGGFALQHDESDPRARNAHALIAADGSVDAVYHKIHLFDAQGAPPSTGTAFLHAPQPCSFHAPRLIFPQFQASALLAARARTRQQARGCAALYKLQPAALRCKLATTCASPCQPTRSESTVLI